MFISAARYFFFNQEQESTTITLNINMILIIFSHPYPHRSHANKTILDSIAKTEHVFITDLYQKYPDFHINVIEEQSLLRQAKLIIFQFPIYWYNVPALLKQWQEMVLSRQFLLGDGDHGCALQGKSAMAVVTAGHKHQSYQQGGEDNYNVEEFLRPLEQLSVHCGMHYHSPLILHQAHKASETELTQFSRLYSQRIEQLYQKNNNNDE
ncbi:MAG: NAD(P)H-dependent oxidoreductase [gamma proteobacterium symbiont of Taylorina sp.]|nr:NAD(P)H-dependent oxidoreductase [gamma proteobacterium symbiont of Taylorina sp.]